MALAALAAFGAGSRSAAQSAEIVRGRVVDAVHQPVADADVMITGEADGFVQHARTSDKGTFIAIFSDPEGSYQITVRKVGYTPVTAHASLNGLTGILVVSDVVLVQIPAPMKTLVVQAPRIVASPGNPPTTGGTGQNIMNGALFTLDPSDLDQLAKQLAGVRAVGDSAYSVLGASPDQNRTVVDGQTFDGATLPRDAIGTVRLNTATFDPSQGQFAGAELVVNTRRGPPYRSGTVRSQLVDPHLSWADPTSPVPAPRIPAASGYIGGPLVTNRAEYLLAFDVSDRLTTAPSLLSPNPAYFNSLGISTDTIAALAGTLDRLGVPLTAPGIPTQSDVLRGSASLRVDYHPTPLLTFTLSAVGNWSHAAGGIPVSGYPAAASSSRSASGRVMLSMSGYLKGVLDEFHASLSPASSRAGPYLGLPAGQVQVGTAFDSGGTGLTWLQFGGNAGGVSRGSSNTLDIRNEVSWTPLSARHQFKFSQEIEEWDHSLRASNAAGMFAYQSLADLAALDPASYQRTSPAPVLPVTLPRRRSRWATAGAPSAACSI